MSRPALSVRPCRLSRPNFLSVTLSLSLPQKQQMPAPDSLRGLCLPADGRDGDVISLRFRDAGKVRSSRCFLVTCTAYLCLFQL